MILNIYQMIEWIEINATSESLLCLLSLLEKNDFSGTLQCSVP